jgi:hypothetical protein
MRFRAGPTRAGLAQEAVGGLSDLPPGARVHGRRVDREPEIRLGRRVVPMRIVPPLLAGLVVAALVACGGDDVDDVDDVGDTTTTAPSDEQVDDGVDDPGEASWSSRSAAPVAATEVGAAVVDGQVWVVGGFAGDGRPLDLVQRYDPVDDSWTEGPALPDTVHHAAVVGADGTLLVVGGYGGGGFGQPLDTVWVLEPGAESWTTGPSLPSPRGAGAAAWDGRRAVFGGGVGPDGLADDVWALSDGAWERVGELSVARDHLGAASDGDGRVWFLGGRLGTLDTNHATVDLADDTGVAPVGSLPTARGGVAGFHHPDHGACLVGGETPERTFAEVECVDDEGGTTSLPSLAVARHGLGAVVVDGVAYVLLGGPEPGLAVTDTVEALSLR